MNYIKIDISGHVQEIIPEYVDIFPNIPISQRYPAEFIKNLIPVDDNVEITNDMVYSYEDNKFYKPENKQNLQDKIKELQSLNEDLTSQITDLQLALVEAYEAIGGSTNG